MAAETFGGAAKSGAVALRHDILHLNRFDGDAFGQVIVETAAVHGREGVLRLVIWTTPRVAAAEKELRTGDRRECRQLNRGPNR
jgi:hypothetical protein